MQRIYGFCVSVSNERDKAAWSSPSHRATPIDSEVNAYAGASCGELFQAIPLPVFLSLFLSLYG